MFVEPLGNLDRAAHLGISMQPLPTLLKGRDLSAAGIDPGPQMFRNPVGRSFGMIPWHSGRVDLEGMGSNLNHVFLHPYNVSTPLIPDSYYTVVVRVTDNDGLVSRDTCTVEIIGQVDTPKNTGDSSSSGSSLGSLSEIVSPPIIGGIVFLVLIIGGVGYYVMTRNDDMPYVQPPKSKQPVSGSVFMDSVVPEVSPVKERKVVERKVVTDVMTIECPECSAQMDVPNISGLQHVQCSECGLEGEFEI